MTDDLHPTPHGHPWWVLCAVLFILVLATTFALGVLA